MLECFQAREWITRFFYDLILIYHILKGFAFMQVELKVIPGAKRNLCKEENGVLKVYLSAPAVEGKANQALIKFLAQHFAVKSGQIEILKGLKSRHKVVNINGI